MKQNEVVLDDNQIGFLSEEEEPLKFLNFDYKEKDYFHEKNPLSPSIDEFYYEAWLLMSESVSYSERRAYTFMDLLGDFGGFNDAIVFIVSSVFASYGARMYEDSIAKRLKIKPKKKLRATLDA